jgi:RNA polymerase sigma-70 factor (ECF subfamily)
MTDEQLVKEFFNGDEEALEVLIEKYFKPIYNFIFQLSRDKNASEDILQDVFVKMWKNLETFEQEKKFSTWLYAIARNTAYDYLKKKKTLPFSAFENENGFNILENIEDQAILHSGALLQKIDNAKDVEKYLKSLSPQLKTILLLHHQQGFSLTEIAEILGATNNTIKSKYHRTLIFLRKLKFSKKNKQQLCTRKHACFVIQA